MFAFGVRLNKYFPKKTSKRKYLHKRKCWESWLAKNHLQHFDGNIFEISSLLHGRSQFKPLITARLLTPMSVKKSTWKFIRGVGMENWDLRMLWANCSVKCLFRLVVIKFYYHFYDHDNLHLAASSRSRGQASSTRRKTRRKTFLLSLDILT